MPPAGLGVVLQHVGAGDVGGHQVGRELNPPERQLQNVGDRADQQRLRQARHADQQAVPPAEQGDEHLVDDVGLPDDDLADLFPQAVVGSGEATDGLGFEFAGLFTGGGGGRNGVGHWVASGVGSTGGTNLSYRKKRRGARSAGRSDAPWLDAGGSLSHHGVI